MENKNHNDVSVVHAIDYSPDLPIFSSKQDSLSRASFADRLAETIAGYNDGAGLVIGLYGAWGDGKTSILNLALHRLRQYGGTIVPIHFNPWQVSGERELSIKFFQTLTEAVDAVVSTPTERVGEWVRKNGGFLSLGGWVDVGRLGESLSSPDMNTYRSRVDSALRTSGKRIVVMMDDIDRLDKAEVQTVFRLVKMHANLSMVTYVLAFDDDMVAAALADRYAGKEGGKSFLEKIVQVPLRVPRADEAALRRMVFSGIHGILGAVGCPLTDPEAFRFKRQFIEGLEPRLTTPRGVNRYLNAVKFAVPLLLGEVNTVDLLLVEGMRVFYPGLHKAVREHRNLLVQDSETRFPHEQTDNVFTPTVRTLGPKEQRGGMTLLAHLFPRARVDTSLSSDVASLDPVEGQHVCWDRYFDRYFTYSTETGELPDSIIVDLLELADCGDVDSVSARLMEVVTPSIADKILQRMDALVLERPSSLKTLVIALARNAWLFDNRNFKRRSPLMSAVDLVGRLILLPTHQSEMEELVHWVIREADPFVFAAYLYFSLIQEAHDATTGGKLRATLAERAMVEKVRRLDRETPLYRAFSEPRVLELYQLWSRSSPDEAQAIRDSLSRRFVDKPEEIIHFLSVALPSQYLDLPGLSGYDDQGLVRLRANKFLLPLYRRIESILDTETLYDAACTAFGLLDPEQRKNRAEPTRGSVLQFVYLFEATRKHPDVLQGDEPSK